MSKAEKIFSVLVLAPILPVVFMLTVWWGSLPFSPPESFFPLVPLIAFAIGLFLEIILLRRQLMRLFRLSFWAIILIELFYTVMVYGFFMGFPVFNTFVCIAAVAAATQAGIAQGYNRETVWRKSRLMNRISTGILFFVCTCSAFLALRERTICSQLKGMLNLPFEVTIEMVWGLILIGGALLLLTSYGLSKFVAFRLMKKAFH